MSFFMILSENSWYPLKSNNILRGELFLVFAKRCKIHDLDYRHWYFQQFWNWEKDLAKWWNIYDLTAKCSITTVYAGWFPPNLETINIYLQCQPIFRFTYQGKMTIFTVGEEWWLPLCQAGGAHGDVPDRHHEQVSLPPETSDSNTSLFGRHLLVILEAVGGAVACDSPAWMDLNCHDIVL